MHRIMRSDSNYGKTKLHGQKGKIHDLQGMACTRLSLLLFCWPFAIWSLRINCRLWRLPLSSCMLEKEVLKQIVGGMLNQNCHRKLKPPVEACPQLILNLRQSICKLKSCRDPVNLRSIHRFLNRMRWNQSAFVGHAGAFIDNVIVQWFCICALNVGKSVSLTMCWNLVHQLGDEGINVGCTVWNIISSRSFSCQRRPVDSRTACWFPVYDWNLLRLWQNLVRGKSHQCTNLAAKSACIGPGYISISNDHRVLINRDIL